MSKMMIMKMVILGAGASYDCIFNHDYDGDLLKWCPPLGRNLFSYNSLCSEILRMYPGAESFRSEISHCIDIEEVFQKKYALAHNPNGAKLLLQIVNVQFYLQHLFSEISKNYIDFGPSNYEILMRQAYDYYLETGEDVVFVTFNYDTLLEKSFEKILGIKIKDVSDYIKYPIKIIKPHGSCNWLKRVSVGQSAGPIHMNGVSAFLYDENNMNLVLNAIGSSNEDYVLFDSPISQYEVNNRFAFPQLLIPLKDKDDFILPVGHKEALKKALEKVNDILIIGWKANEKSFHNFIKENTYHNSLRFVIVCCEDKTVQSRLRGLNIEECINFTEPLYIDDDVLLKDNQPLCGTFSSYMQNTTQRDDHKFFK